MFPFTATSSPAVAPHMRATGSSLGLAPEANAEPMLTASELDVASKQLVHRKERRTTQMLTESHSEVSVTPGSPVLGILKSLIE